MRQRLTGAMLSMSILARTFQLLTLAPAGAVTELVAR
jgi:hypothetical protein